MLRRLFGFRSCLLLAVLAGLVPAVYAQTQCTAIDVSGTVPTFNVVPAYPGSSLWNVYYNVNFTWNCTFGNPPGCIVCNQDTLSVWIGSNYQTLAVNPGQDGPEICGSIKNQGPWNGQFTHLLSGYKYEVTFSFKEWSPSSDCSVPNGWQVFLVKEFET